MNEKSEKRIIGIIIDALQKSIREENDGCCGCMFEDREDWEMPCVNCSNAYVNKYKPAEEGK